MVRSLNRILRMLLVRKSWYCNVFSKLQLVLIRWFLKTKLQYTMVRSRHLFRLWKRKGSTKYVLNNNRSIFWPCLKIKYGRSATININMDQTQIRWWCSSPYIHYDQNSYIYQITFGWISSSIQCKQRTGSYFTNETRLGY